MVCHFFFGFNLIKGGDPFFSFLVNLAVNILVKFFIHGTVLYWYLYFVETELKKDVAWINMESSDPDFGVLTLGGSVTDLQLI